MCITNKDSIDICTIEVVAFIYEGLLPYAHNEYIPTEAAGSHLLSSNDACGVHMTASIDINDKMKTVKTICI